ncbi:RecX family transcriptional regulator [Carnobacteriaceae bacterium zg-C25]|nr:RecX family transcriptional regulator [Carnobacteriaceae bacterium zg-C25]
MAKITTIEVQQNNKHRFNIFIDDQFAFGVSEQTLLFFTLHKGMEITPQQQTKILKYDHFQRLYSAGVNYISYRMRSEKEVRDKLAKLLDVSEDETVINTQQKMIELAIKQLKSDGYINDTLYAQAFVEESLNVSGKGEFHIRRKLKEKGIAQEIVAQVLNEIDDDTQNDTALQVATAFIKRQDVISSNALRQKLSNHLMQRGFSIQTVQTILNQMDTSTITKNENKNAITIAQKAYNTYHNRYSGYDLWSKIKTYLLQKGYSFDAIDRAIKKLKEDYDS